MRDAVATDVSDYLVIEPVDAQLPDSAIEGLAKLLVDIADADTCSAQEKTPGPN